MKKKDQKYYYKAANKKGAEIVKWPSGGNHKKLLLKKDEEDLTITIPSTPKVGHQKYANTHFCSNISSEYAKKRGANAPL